MAENLPSKTTKSTHPVTDLVYDVAYPDNLPPDPEPLSPEFKSAIPERVDVNILWQHILHEDGLYNEHLNFFLVFESLLIMACVTLWTSTSDRVPPVLTMLLIILGTFSVFVWVLVQSRSRFIINKTRDMLLAKDHYYQFVLQHRRNSKSWFRRFQNYFLIGSMVPLMVFLVWLVLAWFIGAGIVVIAVAVGLMLPLLIHSERLYRG